MICGQWSSSALVNVLCSEKIMLVGGRDNSRVWPRVHRIFPSYYICVCPEGLSLWSESYANFETKIIKPADPKYRFLTSFSRLWNDPDLYKINDWYGSGRSKNYGSGPTTLADFDLKRFGQLIPLEEHGGVAGPGGDGQLHGGGAAQDPAGPLRLSPGENFIILKY
jgi:hypothetical protein